MKSGLFIAGCIVILAGSLLAYQNCAKISFSSLASLEDTINARITSSCIGADNAASFRVNDQFFGSAYKFICEQSVPDFVCDSLASDSTTMTTDDYALRILSVTAIPNDVTITVNEDTVTFSDLLENKYDFTIQIGDSAGSIVTFEQNIERCPECTQANEDEKCSGPCNTCVDGQCDGKTPTCDSSNECTTCPDGQCGEPLVDRCSAAGQCQVCDNTCGSPRAKQCSDYHGHHANTTGLTCPQSASPGCNLSCFQVGQTCGEKIAGDQCKICTDSNSCSEPPRNKTRSELNCPDSSGLACPVPDGTKCGFQCYRSGTVCSAGQCQICDNTCGSPRAEQCSDYPGHHANTTGLNCPQPTNPGCNLSCFKARAGQTCASKIVSGSSCQTCADANSCDENPTNSESFNMTATQNKADILFVIDNSGSMKEEQSKMATGFSGFVSGLGTNLNWRIAIISTDVADGGNFVSFNNGSNVLTSTTSNANALFESAVILGTKGSGTEKPFKTAEQAIDNNGSFRSDTDLALVIVSDECNDHNSADKTSFFSRFNGVWPNKGITVHGILNSSACTSSHAVPSAINDTGGLEGDINASSYSSILSFIGTRVSQTVTLSSTPVENNTLQVSLERNGTVTVLSKGSDFEINGNQITVKVDLESGDRVRVNYECN